MPIKFWQFRNSDESSASAELLLYGPISESTWWGDEVTPKQFNKDLKALGSVTDIKVRINSPGGDVFAAAAIYNSLKQHPAQIHTYIDGLAASAASVIAMAGDLVTMPAASMMMIHNPMTIAIGDARDMRATAEVLDKVRDTIIEAYQTKSSMTRPEIINLMNAETWMTGQDAVERGFADEIDPGQSVAATMKGRLMIVNGLGFDIGKFRTVPTAMLGDGSDKSDRLDEGNLSDLTDEAITAEADSILGSGADAAEQKMEAEPMADNDSIVEETPVVEPAAEETAAEEVVELVNDEDEPSELEAIEAAVTAERQRAASIRALNVPGCEAVVEKAIADGLTVEAAAFAILNSEDFRNAELRAARLRDAAALNGVAVDAGPRALTDEIIANMTGAELKARMPEIQAYYEAKRKGAK